MGREMIEFPAVRDGGEPPVQLKFTFVPASVRDTLMPLVTVMITAS